ncbi:MAG TPA: non-canonical purine NTP diphosphatase [Bacteroidales bacterium]|nr:non-canonical purine NTP diphosphatase [Bacteroidales bacterium]
MKKHQLIFATKNRHKLDEVAHLEGLNFTIIGLDQLGFHSDVPEDYETLEENALQKARFIHKQFVVDCFADDTGLEIDALGGRPGVYSARYAGPQCNPEDNMNKVLSEMQTQTNRSARFRTVIVLIMDEKNYFFEGIMEGAIISEKRGEHGFGYDPIFQPKGYNLTFAEMDQSTKNSISHRAKATAKLIEFLQKRG